MIELTNESIRVKLHYGQRKARDSKARIVAIISGTGGGKTSFGPLWIYEEIQKRPTGDFLIVSPSYPMFKRIVLPISRGFFDLVTGGLGNYRESDKMYTFPTGAKVFFGSADNPFSLEGTHYHGIWLDEAGQTKRETWEVAQRRAGFHQARILITTTPYNLGWLKTEVYDRWLRNENSTEVIQFNSIANPQYPIEEFERAKATLPRWKFEMFYEGKFTKPENLIFIDYIDAPREQGGHLVQPFTIPAEWPRYVGIDPGPDHTATVWLAKDPEKNIFYLYRETLEGGLTTREHAERALQRAGSENVIMWILGQASEKQYRTDWRDYGVPVIEPPFKDIETGIDRVIELFKTMRLFIFDACLGIRDELGSYMREMDKNEEITTKIKDKEKFHRLDALRYAVAGLTQKAIEVW